MLCDLMYNNNGSLIPLMLTAPNPQLTPHTTVHVQCTKGNTYAVGLCASVSCEGLSGVILMVSLG